MKGSRKYQIGKKCYVGVEELISELEVELKFKWNQVDTRKLSHTKFELILSSGWFLKHVQAIYSYKLTVRISVRLNSGNKTPENTTPDSVLPKRNRLTQTSNLDFQLISNNHHQMILTTPPSKHLNISNKFFLK